MTSEWLSVATVDDLGALTTAALEAARQAFNARIEADGSDPAYWDIRFTAWILSLDEFKRLRRYEVEEECK